MGSKPLIGLSCWQMDREMGLRQEYISAIYSGGGLPLLIPVSNDESFLQEMFQPCAGLLLSGGGDIDPVFYGPAVFGASRNIDGCRDCYEFKLLELAARARKPVLAICRGMQVLNVYFRGTLYEDLNIIGTEVLPHQDLNGDMAFHWIHCQTGTRLSEILGDKWLVNSNHHQALKEIGIGLRVSAVAMDGIVEAIEWYGDWWTVGVQWHPERLAGEWAMPVLFTEFIRRCSRIP